MTSRRELGPRGDNRRPLLASRRPPRGDRIIRALDQATDACANWLWISRVDRWDLALDAFGGRGAMTAALTPHFTEVQRVDLAHLSLLPYADGTVSCIVIRPGSTEFQAGAGPDDALGWLARVVKECRRVLQPGGCLYVGVGNAWWSPRLVWRLGRSAATDAFPLGGVTRTLTSAGFAEVDAYYAQPSLGDPRSMIPVAGAAPAVHESIQQRRGGVAALRPAVAASPLRRVLYPSLICLAYP